MFSRRFRQAARINCRSNTAHDASPAKKGMKRVFRHLNQDMIIAQPLVEFFEHTRLYAQNLISQSPVGTERALLQPDR